MGLPNQAFRVLSHLAANRCADPSGWVHQVDLGVASGAHRALSRLRKLLVPYPGPSSDGWIENNGHGGYRLITQVGVGWDKKGMRAEHPDLAVPSLSR